MLFTAHCKLIKETKDCGLRYDYYSNEINDSHMFPA